MYHGRWIVESSILLRGTLFCAIRLPAQPLFRADLKEVQQRLSEAYLKHTLTIRGFFMLDFKTYFNLNPASFYRVLREC